MDRLGKNLRKRKREDSTTEHNDTTEDDDYSSSDKDYDPEENNFDNATPNKQALPSNVLLEMVEKRIQGDENTKDDVSSEKKKRLLTPLMSLLGVNGKSERNYAKESPYLAYDATLWNPAYMYRLPQDVTLHTIYKSGGEGVGRNEVGHELMMDTTCKSGNRRVSAFIVNVCNEQKNHIGQYQKMDGKIRKIKYFWKSNNTPEKFQLLFNEFEKYAKVTCPFKMGQVIKFPNTGLNTLRMSDVTLRRLTELLELLEQTPVVVTTYRVLKYLEEREKAIGYNFSIDKKSLLKCIKALESEKLLHLYETNIVTEGITNKIQILCHKDIDSPNHHLVAETIQQTIDQYHREGKVFPQGQLRYSQKKRSELKAKSDANEIKIECEYINSFDGTTPISLEDRYNIFRAMSTRAAVLKKEEDEILEESLNTTAQSEGDNKPDQSTLIPSTSSGDATISTIFNDDIIPLPQPPLVNRYVKMNASMANLYGYQSKILRLNILHEIVYHLVHGWFPAGCPTHNEKFSITKPYFLWKFNPNPYVFVDEEGPLRFIPPLRPFHDIHRGCFMLQDLVYALPLSILVLVAYVPKGIDDVMLDEYLKDSVRRHTLLGDLPNELRIPILRDKKLYRQIEHILLCLCAMGLMCVIQNPDPKRFVSAPSAVFYVSKSGIIYDTSTSQKGYATISEPLEQYDRYDYQFLSAEDIHLYWHHLRAVSLSTPLSFRIDSAHNEVTLQRHKKYSMGLIDKTPFTRLPTDDLSDIKPVLPLDGCGGFDSALFLHLRRHWEINPRPNDYVDWFVKRFRHDAENLQPTIEARVHSLQPDWNSFVKSMMPSDLDLTRNKKAIASSTTIYPSTRASIAIEPKSRTRLQSARKRNWRKKKRPLDTIDLVSQESRIHVRSRFNAREKDMLILIRAVGFFLNPVYRFWLDPVVLRDIMHEYVPESRSKTVESLMAAGVREMTRPNRLAYLQRIVRNLSTFKEMRELRYRLASQPVFTPVAKTDFFKDAFALANRLLFMDAQNMPLPSSNDDEFLRFLKDEEYMLSPEQSQSHPLPLRSRAPIALPHIHHCVAVNVLLGILIHSNEGILAEKVLSQLNATVIHNALQVLRSDGLISRTRTIDPSIVTNTRNQAILSYYFRHFFAHRLHPDIIEQTNLILRSFSSVQQNTTLFPYNGDHVGLVIAASNAFYTKNDLDVVVDYEILQVFEDASMENVQQSTKQIRYLENADLRLEKIQITHDVCSKPEDTTPAEEIVKFLDKSQKNSNAAPSIYLNSIGDKKVRERLSKVYKVVRDSGVLGSNIELIMQKTKMKKDSIKEALKMMSAGNIIMEVGVDCARWITNDYREAWCVVGGNKIVFPKPWTLPDCSICLPTVRWMTESCLFTIVANAGISLKGLHFRFEFALQPAAVTELVYLLEEANCVNVKEEKFPSMEISSPFDDKPPLITCTYIVPTVDCMERFARIFADVSLLPSMVSAFRQDDDAYNDMMDTNDAEDETYVDESANIKETIHLMDDDAPILNEQNHYYETIEREYDPADL